MRTRIGNIPDSLISLSLLLLFLILIAVSIAGQAQANLPVEVRAAGCYEAPVDAGNRTADAE